MTNHSSVETIVILNGPLGIGKSTFAEVLAENLPRCAMISGDALVAGSLETADSTEHLHRAIEFLVKHHQKVGALHIVIEHYWDSPPDLDDLCQRLRRLAPQSQIHRFLLTLSAEENDARIRRRQSARELDELDDELETVTRERRALERCATGELGEPLDVSASPEAIVQTVLPRLLDSTSP